MSSHKKREPAGAKHVAINSYPKIGGGIPVCDGRKNFHEKVMQACSNGINVTLGEKIIVVGDHNVGKTSMMRRYVEDQYSDGYKATIGVDFMCQKYHILDVEFTLHIWDTAGQEQFKSVSRAYFRGASAVILAFDLGNPESLDSTREWLQDVQRENTGELLIFLVGTKSDMFHGVDSETGQQVAAQLNAEYWECSSKQNINIKELFERVSVGLFENAVLRHIEAVGETREVPQVTNIPLNQYSDSVTNSKPKSKGCCG
eukprot:Phypoly_transcript_15094.p1 GENE.Phypoly_transcript_15094~~Phypoly_transcript_15094.p1  ORF type:complete len:258 (+),score=41.33 Phypoly_transcript_15094:111-884(+)